MKPLVLNSLDDLPEAARQLLTHMQRASVYAIHGEMGAGKTAFIKALCKALGVVDAVSSPTYALVNEYLSANGDPVYHFDFYRIDKEEEAIDMGALDYFDSGHICLIEWPERIINLLPDDAMRVHMAVQNDGSRLLYWSTGQALASRNKPTKSPS